MTRKPLTLKTPRKTLTLRKPEGEGEPSPSGLRVYVPPPKKKKKKTPPPTPKKKRIPPPKKKPPQQPKKKKGRSSPPVKDPNRPSMVAARELLAKLESNHPNLFPVEGVAPKPWAIGLHHQIRERYAASMSVTRKAVKLWIRPNIQKYLASLVTGNQRYDLNGNVAGVVALEAEEMARKRMG